jgi:hypothetical protein
MPGDHSATRLSLPAIVLLFCGFCLLNTARADALPDANEMRESVVRIVVLTDNGVATGTGFIIDSRGVIVTNHHVIDGAKGIQVQFLAGGKPVLIDARMIAADSAKDIAIIQTSSEIFGEPVVLADYDTNPPAKVIAVGYPGAANEVATISSNAVLEPSYSVGTVARNLSDISDMGGDSLIQHGATINHGNSGGPLFDECGRVIGINARLVPTTKESEYAQGLFYSIDIRNLFPMLQENLVQPRIVKTACTPRMDTRNDVAPATTKETEAVLFDRFATCIRARPCDSEVCKTRYLKRVSPELATTRQTDVELRMTASKPMCTEQKEASAFDDFLTCANENPCDFEKTCGPKLQQSLRQDVMQKRNPLVERLKAKAQEECKQASAPGIWHGGQVKEGLWSASVFNEGGAGMFVACFVDGENSGNGIFEIDDVKNGKRERWAGTRSMRMSIDSYSEPLRLDLTTQDGKLDAVVVHKETENDRGWLKELIGKLSVGGVATFEDPQVGLDETFSLNGAKQALEPCLKAKFAGLQAAQNDQGQQQDQGQEQDKTQKE